MICDTWYGGVGDEFRFGNEGVLKIKRKRMSLYVTCRTAPATPRLTKNLNYHSYIMNYLLNENNICRAAPGKDSESANNWQFKLVTKLKLRWWEDGGGWCLNINILSIYRKYYFLIWPTKFVFLIWEVQPLDILWGPNLCC